ncbi:ATP-binding protein [Streptomyces sp. Root66D1]|uniref:ATP-binding protein n=1 Tax=unclassified Streptomyces TaxID=2593676 RepID=UPI0032207432
MPWNGRRFTRTTWWSWTGTSRSATATPPEGAVIRDAKTGPVVPGHEIPAFFEPFRRLNRDRLVSVKGAGLGPSVVRAIAHVHGGEATAAPCEGGGPTVTVTLPVHRGPIAGSGRQMSHLARLDAAPPSSDGYATSRGFSGKPSSSWPTRASSTATTVASCGRCSAPPRTAG